MAAALKTIKTLRVTAKLLLIASPLMLLSGFLTAKPYLLESLDFTLARTLHTLVVPLLFVPLLGVHSTAGILFMLNRSKVAPRVKFGLAITWAFFLVALTALYFVISGPTEALSLEDELLVEDVTARFDGAVSNVNDGMPDEGIESGDSGTAEVTADGDDDTAIEMGSDGADAEVSAKNSLGQVSTPQKAKRRFPERVNGSKSSDTSPKRSKAPVTVRVQAQPTPEKMQSKAEKAPPTLEESKQKVPSGSKLVRDRCIGCHGLKTVIGKNRTPAEWRAVIVRMTSMGARLKQTEQQAVLRYLIGRYGKNGE